MKKQIVIVLSLLIAIMCALAFAKQDDTGKSSFSVAASAKQFEAIKQRLEKTHDYEQVVQAVSALEAIKDDAKVCVSRSESQLDIIRNLRKSALTGLSAAAASSTKRGDLTYLSQKETHYTQQLSDCRLLLYRSKETLNDYKSVMQNLSANEILHKSTPIWKLFEENAWESAQRFSAERFIRLSGFAEVSQNQWYSLLMITALVALIAFYMRGILKEICLQANSSYVLWRGLLASIARFIIPCGIFAVFSLFFNAVFEDITVTPALELVSQVTLIFLVAAALTRYLFYPAADCRGIFALRPEEGRRFYHRILCLLVLLLLGVIAMIALRQQPFLSPLIELTRTLYLTLISAVTIWVFFLWYRSSYSSAIRHGSLAVFSTLFISALIALMILEWIGYHRLALFAAKGLCLTAGYTIALVALWRVIDAFYQLVDNTTTYRSARYLHQWLGVKNEKKLHEIVLLKLLAYVVLLCMYLVYLLKSWSISPVFVDGIVNALFEGFSFFGLTIVPLRFAFACLVFSVLFLGGRLIAAALAGKKRFQGEAHTQIAISTITIYVSFAVALLFALLVTGVNFTGLAIIAGALSVGVGLGLQTIVNNFVSGLILLLEKPIKPGDRVVIGNTEGFVRKIRIRSTQITTLSKEDVIVPNADFMTQQVINYMFRDRYSRVKCRVGIAYGSDTQLAKKILLEVADKHEDVVKEAPNAPVVLFTEFGESSLAFELWCVIYDVNKKYVVVSDLNFEIDAAFRAHNITIAFPQRDIWIKNSDAAK